MVISKQKRISCLVFAIALWLCATANDPTSKPDLTHEPTSEAITAPPTNYCRHILRNGCELWFQELDKTRILYAMTIEKNAAVPPQCFGHSNETEETENTTARRRNPSDIAVDLFELTRAKNIVLAVAYPTKKILEISSDSVKLNDEVLPSTFEGFSETLENGRVGLFRDQKNKWRVALSSDQLEGINFSLDVKTETAILADKAREPGNVNKLFDAIYPMPCKYIYQETNTNLFFVRDREGNLRFAEADSEFEPSGMEICFGHNDMHLAPNNRHNPSDDELKKIKVDVYQFTESDTLLLEANGEAAEIRSTEVDLKIGYKEQSLIVHGEWKEGKGLFPYTQMERYDDLGIFIFMGKVVITGIQLKHIILRVDPNLLSIYSTENKKFANFFKVMAKYFIDRQNALPPVESGLRKLASVPTVHIPPLNPLSNTVTRHAVERMSKRKSLRKSKRVGGQLYARKSAADSPKSTGGILPLGPNAPCLCNASPESNRNSTSQS
eukprot:Lankesteria_metandrocarpae@DN2626_c0_g1_i1.p1